MWKRTLCLKLHLPWSSAHVFIHLPSVSVTCVLLLVSLPLNKPVSPWDSVWSLVLASCLWWVNAISPSPALRLLIWSGLVYVCLMITCLTFLFLARPFGLSAILGLKKERKLALVHLFISRHTDWHRSGWVWACATFNTEYISSGSQKYINTKQPDNKYLHVKCQEGSNQ